MLKKNAIATAALLAALASMSPVTALAADRDGYRGGNSYGFESHSEQSRGVDSDRRRDDGRFIRGREQTRFDDERERGSFRQSDRQRESGRDGRNSHYNR